MIWAYPTASAKLIHAFPGVGEPSLCRRYYMAMIELMEVVVPVPDEQGKCKSCERKSEQ